MILETKEQMVEKYYDHTGNLYVNGEIVDGFTKEEVATAMDNGAVVEFFNSTKATTKEIAEEAIEVFIKSKWEPKFYLVDPKNGPKFAELSLVGAATFKEIVYGCLYNMSMLLDIEPVEASDRFKRLALDVLNKIHFRIKGDQIAKIANVEKRIAELNAELTIKIDEYNNEHSETICDVFIKELYTAKPVKKSEDIIHRMVAEDWYPGIGLAESDNHPTLYFVTGEYIHEMVFILGISHDEAVARFNQANETCRKLIGMHDEKAVEVMFLKHKLHTETEGDAMYQASLEMGFLIKRYEHKHKLNKLVNVFASELLKPAAKQQEEDTNGN